MKAEYFPPREDIILQNESPTEFYVVVSGAVMESYRCDNGSDEIVRKAESGDVVGEIGVLCFRPQVFTVHIKKLSQLLRIDRNSFLNLVQTNVVDGQIIMDNLFKHMKESRCAHVLDLAKEIDEMFSLGKGSLMLSLRYAASVGNSDLTVRLLKQGMDPNTADHSGRTPLHIAAANGHLECVQVLLDHGSDPNMQDNEGNVPLWEAIKGRHGMVARLLWENNANSNLETGEEFLSNGIRQGHNEVLQGWHHYDADSNSRRANEATSTHISRATTLDSSVCLATQMSLEKLESLLNDPPKSTASFDKNSERQSKAADKMLWLAKQHLTTDGQQQKRNRSHLNRPIERKLSTKAGTTKAINFEKSLFRVVSAPVQQIQILSSPFSSLPRRVTIFRHLLTSRDQKSGGKLICLPGSFKELMKVAGIG